MLQVHEIFHSLQGEGPFSGRPAVFLRLSGCVKPYCAFCDTPEALDGGTPMSPAHVLDAILAYACPFVVVTGGEPFLQWTSGLARLERDLMAHGLAVQYESSGKAGLPPDAAGTIVLSPKPGQWPGRDVLSGAHALKILWDEETWAETLHAVEASGLPPEKIWLMALGASREEQLKRMPLLWDVCSAHGYRLSPRLHVLAFDRKKGI